MSDGNIDSTLGESEWVRSKGENSMAVSGLGYRKPSVGAGGPFLLL